MQGSPELPLAGCRPPAEGAISRKRAPSKRTLEAQSSGEDTHLEQTGLNFYFTRPTRGLIKRGKETLRSLPRFSYLALVKFLWERAYN